MREEYLGYAADFVCDRCDGSNRQQPDQGRRMRQAVACFVCMLNMLPPALWVRQWSLSA
jgi:hypothetical protein